MICTMGVRLTKPLLGELLKHIHGCLVLFAHCDGTFTRCRRLILPRCGTLFLEALTGSISSCYAVMGIRNPPGEKQSTYWSLKLSPPPSNVDSSASNPSSPFSRKVRSLSLRARFFSSIPSRPTSFGPTVSSRRSFASARSRFRLRSRSEACCSDNASLARTRSDADGRAGPMTRPLPVLRPVLPPSPDGRYVAESISSRVARSAFTSALDAFEANDHL